jgi:hypothetical protein
MVCRLDQKLFTQNLFQLIFYESVLQSHAMQYDTREASLNEDKIKNDLFREKKLCVLRKKVFGYSKFGLHVEIRSCVSSFPLFYV